MRRRLMIGYSLGALLAILLGLAFFGLGSRGSNTSAEYAARHSRGVIAQARVVSSSYDAAGGDPGGWTKQVVALPTAQGSVIVNVGHHYPDSVTPSTVKVIYDPQNPSNAQSLQDYQDFGNYSPRAFNAAFEVAGYIITVIGVLIVIGIIVKLVMSGRKRTAKV